MPGCFLLQVDLMVRPPKPGDESYERFRHETQTIFESLKKRAQILTDALNRLEGKCPNQKQQRGQSK